MLHITTHSGKLEGMHSISTSVLLNPICKVRSKDPKSICHHCYAQRYAGIRPTLAKALERNTQILINRPITSDDIPTINDRFLRLESFGDVQNTQQAANYLDLSAYYPYTTIAAWTKNVTLYERAHNDGHEKLDNFILIYSDPVINGHSDEWYNKFFEAHPLVDYIFVVMDKEHAKNVEINCGARHCLSCLHCYKKGNKRIIREVLK